MRQRYDLCDLPVVGHESFLHQTGLICQQRLLGYVEVMRVGRGNIYQVYIRIVYLSNLLFLNGERCLIQRYDRYLLLQVIWQYL